MCPDGLIAYMYIYIYIYHPLKRWLELTSSIVNFDWLTRENNTQ